MLQRAEGPLQQLLQVFEATIGNGDSSARDLDHLSRGLGDHLDQFMNNVLPPHLSEMLSVTLPGRLLDLAHLLHAGVENPKLLVPTVKNCGSHANRTADVEQKYSPGQQQQPQPGGQQGQVIGQMPQDIDFDALVTGCMGSAGLRTREWNALVTAFKGVADPLTNLLPSLMAIGPLFHKIRQELSVTQKAVRNITGVSSACREGHNLTTACLRSLKDMRHLGQAITSANSLHQHRSAISGVSFDAVIC